jgi:hypothetical protein
MCSTLFCCKLRHENNFQHMLRHCRGESITHVPYANLGVEPMDASSWHYPFFVSTSSSLANAQAELRGLMFSRRAAVSSSLLLGGISVKDLLNQPQEVHEQP